MMTIDADRMLTRLHELGAIGSESAGGRTRLALTDEDKAGRDLVSRWMREAGAEVRIDQCGNLHGVLRGDLEGGPIMIGSHIDTVVRAGAYDGCYGVIAGIEVLEAMQRQAPPRRTIVVTAFTNEEGVRFSPDLLGSRVIAKEISLEDALNVRAHDGVTVGHELERIGYAGTISPSEFSPACFIELHIEQGPVLDSADIAIGIVEAVQGHSWWRVTVEGTANHAGTTPMDARRDAGLAAMKLAVTLAERARSQQLPNVATVGTLTLEPSAINVVPGRATFTVDFRDPRDEALRQAEQLLDADLNRLRDEGFTVSAECVSQYPPVCFDSGICAMLEDVAANLGFSARRMWSGASHDAQMMARICPTGMIFVPSQRGISHNPREHTDPVALAQGTNMLLHATLRLAGASGEKRGSASFR